MARKSSKLNNLVDNQSNTNSHNQQPVKKVKPPRRWFNTIMTIEIVGICICVGLIIAKVIVETLAK